MKPLILSSLDLSSIPEVTKELKKKFRIKYSVNSRKKTKKLISSSLIYLSSASVKVDKDLLKKAIKLKFIFSPSTGTDHLDLKEIKRKKIKCSTITKEFKLLDTFTATSELTFALILNLYRKIIPASNDAKNGIWSREKFTGTQLQSKTIGILGMGRLGKITSKIALGFGMKVLGCDTKVKKIRNVKMVSIQKLFKLSDVISIHLHLNKNTRNLVNMKLLKTMKRTSILINTSRGGIIDERDLVYALNKKLIAGAGLDVIDGEWLSISELLNHKLIKLSKNRNNLIIVPHIGGSTFESISGARRFICKKILKDYKKIIKKI